MMKRAAVVLGALLALMGLVWIGQGFGYIPGSFMTGQLFWAFAGLVSLLLGAALLYAGLRRPRAAS
jgi:hypothetical protein